MHRYHNNAPRIIFAAPQTKLFLLAAICYFFLILIDNSFRLNVSPFLTLLGYIFLIPLGAVMLVSFFFACAIVIFGMTDKKIRHKVRLGLYYHGNGNPLGLKDGEYLPKIEVKEYKNEIFVLKIYCGVVPAEKLEKMSSVISSALNKKEAKYAVTLVDTDVACNYVSFQIEDVTIDRSYTFQSVQEMIPTSVTEFQVQKGDFIDLTTSGSMLVAGKTRSGKTTGVISILLQALLCGQDTYDSSIIIIDPKRAELSMLPHTVTVDEDGEAREILETMKAFETTIKRRQKYLNFKCLETGDVWHWWDLGMHPSFLFIDEYVACRSLFPKKAEKSSDYCIATFDNTLKRIVTMGASAGCYVIISIAEASVEEGGLPTMLKSAMTTKILFKPTLNEGRLIWDSSKLENFPERVYSVGDCWFSSTDDEHDNVTYCHFPHLDFPVFQELGNLLKKYYGESDDGGAP